MIRLYSLLAVALVPLVTSAASFPDGASIVMRDAVEIGLYVPAATNRLRGSTGLFIFFGGMGDSVEHYQKALAPMADALDLVVLVPHLPWFAEPGRAQPLQIMAALEELRGELEQAFQTDAELVVVGGASAGGGSRLLGGPRMGRARSVPGAPFDPAVSRTHRRAHPSRGGRI